MKVQAALVAVLSTAFVAHAAPVENGRETEMISLRDDSKLQARQVMTEEDIRESIESTTPFVSFDSYVEAHLSLLRQGKALHASFTDFSTSNNATMYRISSTKRATTHPRRCAETVKNCSESCDATDDKKAEQPLALYHWIVAVSFSAGAKARTVPLEPAASIQDISSRLEEMMPSICLTMRCRGRILAGTIALGSVESSVAISLSVLRGLLRRSSSAFPTLMTGEVPLCAKAEVDVKLLQLPYQLQNALELTERRSSPESGVVSLSPRYMQGFTLT